LNADQRKEDSDTAFDEKDLRKEKKPNALLRSVQERVNTVDVGIISDERGENAEIKKQKEDKDIEEEKEQEKIPFGEPEKGDNGEEGKEKENGKKEDEDSSSVELFSAAGYDDDDDDDGQDSIPPSGIIDPLAVAKISLPLTPDDDGFDVPQMTGGAIVGYKARDVIDPLNVQIPGTQEIIKAFEQKISAEINSVAEKVIGFLSRHNDGIQKDITGIKKKCNQTRVDMSILRKEVRELQLRVFDNIEKREAEKETKDGENGKSRIEVVEEGEEIKIGRD
jgi:hypothetical protein